MTAMLWSALAQQGGSYGVGGRWTGWWWWLVIAAIVVAIIAWGSSSSWWSRRRGAGPEPPRYR